MTDLTPEKRDEIRALLDAATDGPWVREWDTSDQWWTIHGQPNPAKGDDRMVCPEVATLNHREDWTADVALIVAAVNAFPALLDAADERDRLAAAVRSLAEWHETKAMKARHYRSGMLGQSVVMDKAAEVHDDAADRLRRILPGGSDG